MKIPKDMLDQYPEDPSLGGTQCVHFVSYCNAGKCGMRFKRKTQLSCSTCGAPRQRCKHLALTNEDTCFVHRRARTHSLYSAVVDQISNEEWEAAIEGVGDSHEQVLALAQIALSRTAKRALEADGDPGELLTRIEKYMSIIEKHQKATRGEIVTLRWDDKIVQALKKRFRDYVQAIRDTLTKHEIPEWKTLEIMEEVREATAILGNRLTVPAAKGVGEVRFSKPN